MAGELVSNQSDPTLSDPTLAAMQGLSGTPNPATSEQPSATPGDTYNQTLHQLGANPQQPSLTHSIIAAAITGMMKGLSAKPGPGNLGRAAEAGFTGEMEREQQQKAEQQQAQDREVINKARVLEMNMNQLKLQQTLSDKSKEIQQSDVDRQSALIQQMEDEAPGEIGDRRILEQDASNTTKYPSGEWMRIPDGIVENANGQWEKTYTMVRNHPVQITDENGTLKPWAQEALESGIPEAQNFKTLAGQKSVTVPSTVQAMRVSDQSYIEGVQDEINQEAKALGIEPKNIKTALQENPGLMSAVRQFGRTSSGSSDPSQQITALLSDPKTRGYGNAMVQLFGGVQAVHDLATIRNMDAKTAQAIVDRGPEGLSQAVFKKAQDVIRQHESAGIPKNLGEAEGRLVQAQQALRANPQDQKLQQSVKDADSSFQHFKRTQISLRYADAMANAEAGRAVGDKDLETVAQALANPSSPNNITVLKDIASMRGDQRLRLYAMAKQINSNFDPGTMENRAKFVNEFTNPNGRTQMNIAANNTFLEHAGDLIDTNEEWRKSTTGIPLLNTPLNKIRDKFGDAAYTKINAAIQPVQQEYTNALKGGYAPTELDEKSSRTLLNPESSPAQIEEAVKTMAHTVLRRTDSINQNYKRVMGTDYQDLLSPNAIAGANKAGVGDIAGKYGTAGAATPGIPHKKFDPSKLPDAP